MPDASAYFNRGVSEFQAGNFKAAIANFTRAIELAPNNASAYYNRGSAQYYLNDYYGAIADYEKAAELNPNLLNPNLNEAYYFACRSYALRGQKEKALQSLQKALEKGYNDFQSIESNQDLNSIRALPEFRKLVDGFKAKA